MPIDHPEPAPIYQAQPQYSQVSTFNTPYGGASIPPRPEYPAAPSVPPESQLSDDRLYNSTSTLADPAEEEDIPKFVLKAETDVDLLPFSDKAIWGPIQLRMLPNTKSLLSQVISKTIKNLSRQEYDELRRVIEVIYHDETLKQRMFELTGFKQKDLDFARKYFLRYRTKFLFARVVRVALATSSNGKVSRQVGGLIQFIFELHEVDGKVIPLDLKVKLLGSLPFTINYPWEDIQDDCYMAGCTRFADERKLDLNFDGDVNEHDVDIAMESIYFLKNYYRHKK